MPPERHQKIMKTEADLRNVELTENRVPVNLPPKPHHVAWIMPVAAAMLDKRIVPVSPQESFPAFHICETREPSPRLKEEPVGHKAVSEHINFRPAEGTVPLAGPSPWQVRVSAHSLSPSCHLGVRTVLTVTPGMFPSFPVMAPISSVVPSTIRAMTETCLA
jgi:hypothetical protein